MLKRSTIIIDGNKSEKFKQFVNENVKTDAFWKENERLISQPVDKEKLDALFNNNAI